jgi:hypothetical protein
MDFVTIIFNDKTEIDLLKLQAYSFKFVDNTLINYIYIIYNDLVDINLDFIINWYPNQYQHLVKILYIKDWDNINNQWIIKNPWQMQQLLKLFTSKYIFSDFYCVLDTKNHFIKKVNYNDFFNYDNDEKKYYIFTSIGSRSNSFYMNNSLNYFYGKKKINNDFIISMSSPFVFERKTVIDMINYIEKKENKHFGTFFINLTQVTEFYLYSSYVLFSEKKNYCFKEIIHTSIHKNPNESWTLYFINNKLYNEENWKIFGLHRCSINDMSEDFKKLLLDMYMQFYEEEIILFIKNLIKYNK